MIELITGMAGEPHISSNDDRAFNRSIFGNGKYILSDDNKAKVTVTPTAGVITIDSGSLLWSGMHIRITELEQLNYALSASAQTVNVYLHYTKDPETLIEDVSFVVVANGEKTTTDELEDNTRDAYTLFYSFETSGYEAVENGESHFTSNYTHLQLKDFSDASAKKFSVENIYWGVAGLNTTINLNESFDNFRCLMFRGVYDSVGLVWLINHGLTPGTLWPLVMQTTQQYSDSPDLFLRTTIAQIKVISDTQLSMARGNQIVYGKGHTVNGPDFFNPENIRGVYGIGRIR